MIDDAIALCDDKDAERKDRLQDEEDLIDTGGVDASESAEGPVDLGFRVIARLLRIRSIFRPDEKERHEVLEEARAVARIHFASDQGYAYGEVLALLNEAYALSSQSA